MKTNIPRLDLSEEKTQNKEIRNHNPCNSFGVSKFISNARNILNTKKPTSTFPRRNLDLKKKLHYWYLIILMIYHKVYKEKSEFALHMSMVLKFFCNVDSFCSEYVIRVIHSINCGECIKQKVTFLWIWDNLQSHPAWIVKLHSPYYWNFS